MPTRRQVVCSSLSLALTPLLGASVRADSGASVGGWREALIVVPDAKPWIDTLQTVGGWEVAWRSHNDNALNEAWQLPADARTQQTLLRNIGSHSGFIRLVTVTGAPQQRIRAHDQAWETGGISAIDLRVLDIELTRRELEKRGWNAPTDPVRYTTYGFDVIQWAPRSPDGVRLSFIQRIAPPLQGWDELKHWSRATNAAILVRDMAQSQKFYESQLGLKAFSQSNTVGNGGANVMGLPWQFSASIKTDIRGFNGSPAGDSAIELIAMPEAGGRDYAANARPPNLGIAGLRFVMGNAAALASRLAEAAVVTRLTRHRFNAPPFADARLLTVMAPDGVWLEFLQPNS